MEAGSTALGVTRVALQVVTTYKGPHVEVYYQFHNRSILSSQRITESSSITTTKTVQNHNRSDLFLQFSVISVGGRTAYDVIVEIDGELQPHPRTEFDGSTGETKVLDQGTFNDIIKLAQLAPGQNHFLLTIQDSDLLEKTKSSTNYLRGEKLRIQVMFNSQGHLLGWFKRKFRMFLGHSHEHKTEFIFDPSTLISIPPTEYVGQ